LWLKEVEVVAPSLGVHLVFGLTRPKISAVVQELPSYHPAIEGPRMDGQHREVNETRNEEKKKKKKRKEEKEKKNATHFFWIIRTGIGKEIRRENAEGKEKQETGNATAIEILLAVETESDRRRIEKIITKQPKGACEGAGSTICVELRVPILRKNVS